MQEKELNKVDKKVIDTIKGNTDWPALYPGDGCVANGMLPGGPSRASIWFKTSLLD